MCGSRRAKFRFPAFRFLALGLGAVWVADYDGTIYRIDADTGEAGPPINAGRPSPPSRLTPPTEPAGWQSRRGKREGSFRVSETTRGCRRLGTTPYSMRTQRNARNPFRGPSVVFSRLGFFVSGYARQCAPPARAMARRPAS